MVCPSETSPLNKFRPRPRSCHEDRQTSGHVKKAFRGQQAFNSEAYGRLPTAKSESQIPLPVRRPQNRQNENHQALTPTATETMAAGAEGFGNATRRIQRWPEGDLSTSYIGDSTRIKSSPRSVATAHYSEAPDMISIPSLDGPRLNLDSNEPTTLAQTSFQNGHVIPLLNLTPGGQLSTVTSETLEFPRLLSNEEDHLIHLDDDEHGLGSISANVTHPELISDTQDDSQPILYFPYPMEQEPNPQEGTTSDKRSRIQSTSREQQHHLPLPHTLDQLEISLRNYDAELVGGPEANISSARSNGPNHPVPNASQRDFTEPEMEWASPARVNSNQQQYPAFTPVISNSQINISVRPDFSEQASEKHTPQSVSSKHDENRLVSNILSSLGSSRSHKRGKVWGQQRRRHKFLIQNLLNRANAYGKRVRLRQSRFNVSIADEAFMKLVREKRMQGNEEDLALEECYRRLQEARNEYGPLEEAYNETEEQLDRGEFEAKELEEEILMRDVSEPGFDFESGSSSTGEVESVAPVITNHPLYDKFVAHIWEAELCREKISDLVNEHESLFLSQELRRRVGMALAPEDQLTLQNFPAAEAKLLDQLRQIEAEIEDSRLACIREGLLDEGEYEDEEDEEGGEIILQASSVGVVAPEQADYNKYHLLMEKPENKEDEGKSKVLLTDFTEGDVGDRITCWLLHKLRSSGLEVELLASYTDGLDRLADTEKWQEEVLEFWFVDSANLESSAYVGKPTLTAIPPVPIASPNGGFDSNLGNMHEIQMIVRSSALSQRLELGMRLNLKRTNGRSVITE